MSEEQSEKALTPKQEIFCQEFLKDANATQACIRAGYSKNNPDKIGPELLGNSRVQRRIQELMDERSKRTRIDADYVLTTIHDTIERCRALKPVTFFGKPIMVKVGENEDGSPKETAALCEFDSKGVLKGCELLGKHLKLFADRVEHSGPGGKPIEISGGLSDSQLDARIAALLTKQSSPEPDEVPNSTPEGADQPC